MGTLRLWASSWCARRLGRETPNGFPTDVKYFFAIQVSDLRVCSPYPLFHRLIDRLVYMVKSLLAHDMAVVVGPASDHAIEAKDQYSGRESSVRLDGFSNLLEEGFDTLLGRFDQQFVLFARLVLAYILAEEVEPFIDVRDEGLLW